MAVSLQPLPSPYSSILDLLPFPAALVDATGRLVHRNAPHRARSLWRKSSRVDQASNNEHEKRSREDPHWHRAVCAEAARTGKTQFLTETVTDSSGAIRHCKWLCVPLTNEQGRAEQLLLVELGDTVVPERLGDRELEVFEHMGLGRTTQEIADAMLLSPKTVESYRARIKEKLGVEHNTELIRRAVQWVEGVSRVAEQSLAQAAFLEAVTQEIRSPLSAIAGLASSLAQHASSEQAHLTDLILTSTEHLLRDLDRRMQATQRRE